MFQIFLRFYEELNDFLPEKWKKKEFSHFVAGGRSVKAVIESLGVPHTEVDLILVNHESVDFSYGVQPDDHISVYPVFEAFDIQPITRLRPKPLRETRFILDVHLGKLAIYLRFSGFDTLYQSDYNDKTLAQISAQDHRILLTRDRELLKRRMITHGYYVRATHPKRQLREVFARFHLSLSVPLVPRCTRCNGIPEPVSKAEIFDRLPPLTQQHFDEFFHCEVCDVLYWKGSHYQRMQVFLQAASIPEIDHDSF
ncbi:hypothetical protein U27_07040 [Candidatus Vecturithrix granuli]|uniref:Twitching motility protein PilT n=1 Tax=Vecturithrix granuli TaxID=1499967 RepID=A0A081C647_VECG1|nr:hypothetical protein U27_07040 [Candidatus Vecturithrix granuli]